EGLCRLCGCRCRRQSLPAGRLSYEFFQQYLARSGHGATAMAYLVFFIIRHLCACSITIVIIKDRIVTEPALAFRHERDPAAICTLRSTDFIIRRIIDSDSGMELRLPPAFGNVFHRFEKCCVWCRIVGL